MNRKTAVVAVALAIVVALSGSVAFKMVTKDTAKKIRVACVGDSITEGTNYPDDLWMLLGANFTVKTFGVGGSTASLDSDNPYIETDAFQQAKQFQPNIVIVMLGTNDANAQITHNSTFVSDYARLIREFEMLSTKPKIWIATPPPIFSNITALNEQYLTSYVIPAIEQVAAQTNVQTIDVYSALLGHSDMFWDGVHPDEQGSELIAQAIYKAITAQTA